MHFFKSNNPLYIAEPITTPSYNDLIKLRNMGVEGAVIGSAIYKGLIDLKKCIEICNNYKGD